ncbi:MAG: methyl-accepting chemotaxis protein [Terriglobales bacterium]
MLRGVALEGEYNSILTHEVAQVESARQVQVMFKKQVQAWKDILLRGSDPASLEKYSNEFFSLEKKVGETASTLQSSVNDPDVQEKMRAFAEAHRQLGEKYRVGLEEFRVSKGKDFATVDKMVKGQDRPPTDLIDDVVDRLQKAYATSQTRIAASAASARRTTIAGILLTSVIALFVATYLSRRITKPIHVALERAEAIAQGDLTGNEIAVASQDELGDLTRAINKMSAHLKRMILSITESSVQVASASEELNTTSQQITANSEETSAQADVVSKAAQTVSQNLQTVATGAEEMGASIKEIAKNATEAAKVATAAVRVAETTTATVSKLGDSSTEIGQVIKVITSIAQQTNLLALNATIEAARAGEAGKGFAVVANEVKELAKETAKATEDISRKIEAIQTDTKAAVDAIASISGVIHQVNDISSTIATAVEEQNATTNEMSRNVSEAAHGSGEITSNIGGVAEAAQGTTRGASDTQKASQQLVETSAELRRLVEQFKINASESGRGNDMAATQPQSKAAHASA